ncbi:hypothetical protein GCM10025868_04790 [Angustibacter aerolatus]|uniref:DUF3459 domain-containing protein n=1 Tax=Angustibacter aerolatus TaxID=1162965 RepID=A0ABQ6JBQ8_9ACTN|nr:hypothetical protein GCM10025868_04790 [Angustibacter aerolatus]
MLDWSEPAQSGHARTLRWYRDLIALRRDRPEAFDGDLTAVSVRHAGDDQPPWLVLRNHDLAVACNLSPEPQTVPVPGVDEPAARLGQQQH